MSTLSIIPKTYDVKFLIGKMNAAGVLNHYGHAEAADGIHLRYPAENYDAVQAVIAAYPTQYADEVLRPQMMAQATEIRYEKQQTVPDFNGSPLPADDVTVGRVIAALDLMDRNPDLPQTRNWKVAPNTWAILDYATINAMGRAIGMHIQACFDREMDLHAAMEAAPTIDELSAIDVTAGWP